MANANALSVCPRCESETPSGSENCVACGFVLEVEENRYFAVPDYVHFQISDLIGEAEKSEKSTDARKAEVKKVEIRAQQDRFWEDCKDEVRLAAINDALKCMKTVVNSRATVETMKQLTVMGKQIGKISSAIEDYFRSGGQFNGTKLSESTASLYSEESQESAGGIGSIL